MPALKAFFTVAGLQPEYGGPSHSVPALAKALADAGVKVELFTCASMPGQNPPRLPPKELVTTHLLSPASRSIRWLPATNAFVGKLLERGNGAYSCVIHDHGLWLPTNHATAYAARRLNIPLIVSPRGMLTTWARQHRGWKKDIAWRLYQQRDLQTARVLHATSTAEVEDFRAMGLRQPIAVIPNGIELPAFSRSAIGNQQSAVRTLLYLGRIHPVKGLLDLVQAWAQVRAAGWRVVIAGGDELNHSAEVQAAVRAQNLENVFQFVGEVSGEAKWNLYRQADLFVLPSHSENFGLVVAEALACGVPVIATRGAPWEGLRTNHCGWWCDIGSAALAAALREATALPVDARREMGLRGQAWMQRDFSWKQVASQMKLVYEWLVGEGGKPDCIVT